MILTGFRKECKGCFKGRLLIFNRNLTMSHTNNSIIFVVSGQKKSKQVADLYDSHIYSQPQKMYIHLRDLSKA